MTVTRAEIKDIKTHLITVVHERKRAEQLIDQSYYDDTFPLPLIKDAKYIIRTGAAAKLVDGITQQLISPIPQVFRNPVKDTASSKESASKVASFLNNVALRQTRETPNRYEEAFKNGLVRGEFWYYVVHNEKFDKNDPNSVPFRILAPDPLVVFLDPGEVGEEGRVNRLIMLFERSVNSIKAFYPTYVPKDNAKGEVKTSFLMYWDNEVRYFEADEQPLLTDAEGKLSNGDGLQENVYGFVPFVHSYAGFGKDSPDGDPASLAVSRLRKTRDLFKEDCQIGSDVSFIIHKFAHKHYDIINKSGESIGDQVVQEYDTSPGIIQEVMLPQGADITVQDTLIYDPQVFQYYANIQGRLAMENPLAMGAFGSSGRQEDILRGDWRKQYEPLLHNVERASAAALGMGLKMMSKLPSLLPSGMTKADIGGDYNCEVKLKTEDPINRDRLSLGGRAMVQAGQLSLRSNLIKYQGYTEEEADDEIDNILTERYMFQSPDIAELMQVRAAEKSGMAEDIEALRQKREQLEKKLKSFPLGSQIGSQGGEPRIANIKTERGFNEADISRTQSGLRSTPR